MGSGFEVKDGKLRIRINPQVYPLERVYATAYVFLDRFYFILDGDRDKEIILEIVPKDKAQDLEKFAYEFFEEMLSITNYFNQFDRNKEVIGLVLQRALFSVVPEQQKPEDKTRVKLASP
ncbi:TPA: hypothetical protein HA295_04765 [Candidatus Woesearchaeota archaeon]|nr:hypothetical protein [Candidatus Woesearchaeota archaeon]HII66059.1 hypothetical protein [Candidatus Woesearchaeota archaeon]